MNCSDFVARFTDYVDGSATRGEIAAMDAHAEGCGSCRRYKTVFEHGASILRTLPQPELMEDFEPRLRHRIYHLDDLRRLSENSASGTPALSVLGIALVLTAVAWSPTLRGELPVVELDPIVVDRAPARSAQRTGERAPDGPFWPASFTDLDRGLWDNAVLYEYSPLSQRYRRVDADGRLAFDRDR